MIRQVWKAPTLWGDVKGSMRQENVQNSPGDLWPFSFLRQGLDTMAQSIKSSPCFIIEEFLVGILLSSFILQPRVRMYDLKNRTPIFLVNRRLWIQFSDVCRSNMRTVAQAILRFQIVLVLLSFGLKVKDWVTESKRIWSRSGTSWEIPRKNFVPIINLKSDLKIS